MNRPVLLAGLFALFASGLAVTPAAAAPASVQPVRERDMAAAVAAAAHRGADPDATFGPPQRARAMATAQRHAAATAHSLDLSPRERLHVTDVLRDADGQLHVRYDRTFAGLPVIGGDLVVHRSAAGGVVDSDFASTADLSELPTLQARVPVANVRTAARQTADLEQVDAQAAPAKAVYAVGSEPRLVWESVVTGEDDDGPQRSVVYIDARTGRLVNSWSMIPQARGRGRSLYAGTVSVTTDRPARRFRLRDNSRGGTRTHDAHSRPLGIGDMGRLFTDANNVWGTGTVRSRQSAAVDAHYGAARTWDYFRSRFNRRGVFNNGRGVVTRVHYGRPGTPAAGNAFWDDRCRCVTLGSGDRFLRPVVSLDVVAHEMTHGITSRTAGLFYFGESGGLNEATSDIFGSLVEFSAGNRRDRGDYLLGEKVVKPRPGFLRRMDRPRADGDSYNCWSPTMGRDDVHFTSGPANHFFYLLAEGSRAKMIGGRRHQSPTCNGSAIGGIGRTRAGRIWYRALTVYMTSTTDYRDARDATVRAARDLYGRNSGPCRAVVRSWEAVTVRAQNEGCNGALPTPGGGNLLRNAGFEAGDNGVWSVPPGVIVGNPRFGFAHRGRHWAYLGGRAVASTETLSQEVLIPAAAEVRLRFQLAVLTEEPRGVAARDRLRVLVERADGSAQQVAAYSNRHASDSYTQRDLNLSRYAGQQVTLRFEGRENANARATAFWLDDIELRTR